MTSQQFAVIGNPIEHSLSPEIHQAFAFQCGINLTYIKLFSETDAFEVTVKGFFAQGGRGMNVTAPFKNDAYRFSQTINTLAETAEAVNTLQATSNGISGFNTDGIGLVSDLQRLGWLLHDEEVLVLGAGGAAQGIIQSLLNAGAKVTLTNRTIEKAHTLSQRFQDVSVTEFDQLRIGFSIVINATSLSWQEQKLPFDKNSIKGSKCYDLAYSIDGTTSFLGQVSDVAESTSEGLGMLVEQAAESFHIWHGVKPDSQTVLSQLRSPKTRYIAGAVCPKCGEQDTIYIELDLVNNPVKQRCNVCSFNEDSQGNVGVSIS